MDQKGRICVALMITNLIDDFSNKVCKGAVEIAEKEDVNLLIVPGKYIDRHVEDDDSQRYDYQYNTLFSFARQNMVDVIVMVAGSICYATTDERKKEFVEAFHDIPIITVGAEDGGDFSVVYDSDKSLEEGISYLIEKAGKTKIANICGPADYEEGKQRLKVYKDTLKKHGIEPKEELIAYGTATRTLSGALDKLYSATPDLEAIVCVNDDTAIGAYKELIARKKKIGKEIYVLGFDGLEEDQYLNPPLSTIFADATELGRVAIKSAKEFVRDGNRELRYVPTHFLARESVGCVSEKKEKKIPEDGLYSSELFSYKLEQQLSQSKMNYIAKSMLMFQDNEEENSFAMLLKDLPAIDIQNALLMCYEKPYENYRGWDFEQPGYLRVKAELHNGVAKDVADEVVLSNQVMNRLFADGERHTMVLMNLHSNRYLYGLCACDLKYQYYAHQELISYQMSCAIKMLNLLKENKRAFQEVENISKTDELTGILNRRGFFQSVKVDARKGKYAYALYADLDGLKKINDNYGHEAGDFAIHACAQAIKKAVTENGIAGRMGGDEFAAVYFSNDTGLEQIIQERITDELTKVNDTANKPFKVSTSIGIKMVLTKDLTEEVLNETDKLLYEQKMKKKRG